MIFWALLALSFRWLPSASLDIGAWFGSIAPAVVVGLSPLVAIVPVLARRRVREAHGVLLGLLVMLAAVALAPWAAENPFVHFGHLVLMGFAEIFFVAALALVASLNRTRLAPIFVGAYLTLTGTAPVLSGLLPFGGA